jgi:hypothetical protein
MTECKKTLKYGSENDADSCMLLKNVVKHGVHMTASYLRFQLLRGGAD